MQIGAAMSDGKTVLLVMGSTRAGRLCPRITAWIQHIGQSCTDLRYEVIDLADWPLPANDEPGIPALTPYSQPHTQAWSEKVKGAGAVVFVTPQFNWGYPAVLKNAIDHLYHEWRGKPVAFVTYGGHGGTRCARQLKRVAVPLKMSFVLTAPALYLPEAVIRHNAPFDPGRDFARHVGSVQKALKLLVTQIAGRESWWAQLRRRLVSLLLAIT